MFIRYATHRVKGKTYRYPQLVEGYRKASGTPSHRVLCSLNSLSEAALANLSTALQAGRAGKRVVVAPETVDVFRSVGVMANLRYLDIAVAYEQWQGLQLPSLLTELLPEGDGEVPPTDMVAALVMHRCTDPGSKLAASRWYPKTALPELQGIAPARFHNTRVHRTLEALERVEADLQARLAAHLGATQGRFAALFMDITDTWFEGRGPEMAYTATTKEGMVRKKVGVVLLCDQRGYPLRWETLPGDYYEARAMAALVEQISTLDWVHQVPVVLDRMMGKAGVLAELSASNVRFVTVVPANEFESWTQEIPWQPLAEVTVAGTEDSAKDDMARVHAALRRTKMVKAGDRWLLDLGVVTRVDIGAQAYGTGATAEAVRLATAMKADLDAKRVTNQSELAERAGITSRSVQNYLKLAALTPEIQRRVLSGEAEGLSLEKLRSIASRPSKQQAAAFDDLLKKAPPARFGPPLKTVKRPSHSEPGLSIRLVVGFKPERFVEQRRKALETRRGLDAFLDDLNRRLRSPHSHRTVASIQAEVDRYLRPRKWLGLFQVIVEGQATGHFQVKLALDEQAWAKRTRYDGFTLFAAHPDMPISAPQLVETYLAKDTVEKDFQTIKSELELRPVRHRTDPKVRAHVTLCMLALLVQRQLELRMKAAGLPTTAPRLLDALAPIHLNRVRLGTSTSYTVTECDPDVAALVTALGVQHLVEDQRVMHILRPRGSSAS